MRARAKESCIQGKKLLRSRDITWHGHLREKVKFLVSVRVLVRVLVMVRVRVVLGFFPPEPSKECVKVSHVIFERRVINHHPFLGLPLKLACMLYIKVNVNGGQN